MFKSNLLSFDLFGKIIEKLKQYLKILDNIYGYDYKVFKKWIRNIGGFLGFPDRDLLIRWMQLGVFHSHSRIHGMGKRELYKFKPDVLRICREYIRLRYRLLPYIYGSAIVYVEKSLPMTIALVIEYQNDPNVWNIGNEFMFDDSLLIAPITNETNKRAIYLPEGIWTDWWTGERIDGRKWINIEIDIERCLSTFVKVVLFL